MGHRGVKKFRSHISRSPGDAVDCRIVRGFCALQVKILVELRQSEVCDQRPPRMLLDQNVMRLDVSVDHAMLMQSVDGSRDFLENADDLLGGRCGMST